jgi:hypothetical protein
MSVYPRAIRPYYKGHSREEDEKLADELFFGTSAIINEKTGRSRHDYLPANGSDERLAFEALERLLSFSCGDLNSDVLGGLLASLDRSGSFGRRFVFEEKRKRAVGAPTDLQIALYVQSRHRLGLKIKAAEWAAKEFGVSRKTVYAALKRIRCESPWLKI